ncbi:putative SAM-dependent methyltransferase [Bernardetia litoralis DSM 6794]|uniref:Ribosomal RNA large subunit methyltransferase F n=1 Tax=Bernardetia litoralis (strain ATCC 23117 / DSM 6794 / NBRC 15988 / NCIMB 1366 / Fx l1 / Sio-4) TaxID=880071 RepID=I4ANC4_BERLS|nr:23S rRNA (adenine(1618)-N(6))-methyltransferase RlmF [Bernardetia litoralis]AFM05459.1 putative SAM-dependent methyltransferase [Bernardetia litoralis DSM 6794]
MHPNNIHNSFYNFEKLIASNPALKEFVFINQHKIETIDFANEKAVLELNKSLLAHHHDVKNWNIPDGYLCPPIPSRADYLYYLNDLLEAEANKKTIKGLDIGVGANCIYPILASQLFDWKMVGADIDKTAIESAIKNVETSSKLKENIEIRYQESNANIFKGIINENEYFDFTICNPPFHASEKDANSAALRKVKNLKSDSKVGEKTIKLNFGGQANELWCNGGEALFIKRMIKQSVEFKNQVNWFTTLVSKGGNLKAIYKQLDKLKAEHKTINMEQGNKKTRFIAWKF